MTRLIRAYGDARDDGVVQVSFTLPAVGSEAAAAARELCGAMGLHDPVVACEKRVAEGFTFFVAYGRCQHAVDLDRLHSEGVVDEAWDMDRVDATIRAELGRKVCVVGAAIESDAHTVGIDAILNMKGVKGHYGLERYGMFEVHNLGAQVGCEELMEQAQARRADAVLVSLVVTQKQAHLHALTKLADLLEAEGVRERLLLIAGGPRITHDLARELGYDAGFGAGTVPEQVATFIVSELVRRRRDSL